MGRKTWADNRNTFTLSSVFAAQRTLDGGWNWLQLSRTPRLNCNALVTQFACIRVPRFSKKKKKKSYNAVETQWPQCGGKSRLDIQFSFQINLLHFFLSSLTITLLERYLIIASVVHWNPPPPFPRADAIKSKVSGKTSGKWGFGLYQRGGWGEADQICSKMFISITPPNCHENPALASLTFALLSSSRKQNFVISKMALMQS